MPRKYVPEPEYVGDCIHCGSSVTEHTERGGRIAYTPFREPERVTLLCPKCGELEANEVKGDDCA